MTDDKIHAIAEQTGMGTYGYECDPSGYNLRFARALLAAQDASTTGPVVGDMAMLIKQLVHSLKKANPNSELPARAVDYLKRKNLLGSPLRAAPAAQTEDLAGAVWDGPNTASQVDPCMGLPAKGRG